MRSCWPEGVCVCVCVCVCVSNCFMLQKQEMGFYPVGPVCISQECEIMCDSNKRSISEGADGCFGRRGQECTKYVTHQEKTGPLGEKWTLKIGYFTSEIDMLFSLNHSSAKCSHCLNTYCIMCFFYHYPKLYLNQIAYSKKNWLGWREIIIVRQYAYSFSCPEIDETINTTHMFVC